MTSDAVNKDLETIEINTPYNGESVTMITRKGTNDGDIARDCLMSDSYGFGLHAEQIKGRVCVDLGAHCGASSIALALLGASHVYAVEAVQANVTLLCANASNNGLIDVVHPTFRAIGDTDKEVSVGFGPDDVSGTMHRWMGDSVNPGSRRTRHNVRMLSMATLFERFQGDCAFLKCDCEGGEWGAFRAAPDSVLRRIRYMVGEIHYGMGGSSWEEFMGFFRGILVHDTSATHMKNSDHFVLRRRKGPCKPCQKKREEEASAS